MVPQRLASQNEEQKCTRAPIVEHNAKLFLRLNRLLSMTLAVMFQQRYYDDDPHKRGGNADADS
jgi:hypothetical protein